MLIQQPFSLLSNATEGFHDDGKLSSHAVLRAELRKLGVLKLLNLWQLALLHLAIYQVACLYSWCCNSKTGRMLHINTWAEPGSLYVCVCAAAQLDGCKTFGEGAGIRHTYTHIHVWS